MHLADKIQENAASQNNTAGATTDGNGVVITDNGAKLHTSIPLGNIPDTYLKHYRGLRRVEKRTNGVRACIVNVYGF